MSPESKRQMLKDRALFLQKARSFFIERDFLEVDTPLLSTSAPIDEHIDIMTVSTGSHPGYLHSSPEYAMKRLLSLGVGDIFQLSHVFRKGEIGALHNPEFTLVEWYRVNKSFPSFIEESVAFIRLFLGPLPFRLLTYREAFLQFAEIDYLSASLPDLFSAAQKHGVHLSSTTSLDKEGLLHLLMGFVIEPNLGKEEIVVLTDYPASQAALAVTEQKGEEIVAKRFEIYYQGIELANGYLELSDAIEQEKRFIEALTKRRQAGKEDLPIDRHLLQALQKGFPPCCGVAAGFDRLFLLQQKATTLQEVLPFAWEEL